MFNPFLQIKSLYASVRVGITLERGEFGTRAIIRRPWDSVQAEFCHRHAFRELSFSFMDRVRSGGDYRFLSKLYDLEGLRFGDPDLNDLTVIEELSNLRALDFSFIGNCKKGMDFRTLPRLEHLWIADPLPQQDTVFECANLRQLWFPLRRHTRSTIFVQLSGLEQLSLWNGPLQEVDAFARFKQLTKLELLKMPKLVSLDGLSGATSLRYLRIDGCGNIGTLAPLAALPQLESLTLNNAGEIESLEPLLHCTRLQRLQMGGTTFIKDGRISVLKQLPQLSNCSIRYRAHYDTTDFGKPYDPSKYGQR